MEDKLILVNENDEQIGSCGKLEAHEKALLHRAFSVFIFRKVLVENSDGSRDWHTHLLIQKRAAGKYHSAGLWANSCCSHPRDGESLEKATLRRLEEETGIKETDLEGGLKEAGAFIYKAEFDNGLTEHELDHVFVGWLKTEAEGSDTRFEPIDIESVSNWPGRNPTEADEMKFVELDWLRHDALINTSKYSAWFTPALMIAIDLI